MTTHYTPHRGSIILSCTTTAPPLDGVQPLAPLTCDHSLHTTHSTSSVTTEHTTIAPSCIGLARTKCIRYFWQGSHHSSCTWRLFILLHPPHAATVLASLFRHSLSYGHMLWLSYAVAVRTLSIIWSSYAVHVYGSGQP